VRASLPDDIARTVACSIVHSLLDYCNALFTGMSEASLSKLQRVQNTLSRVVGRGHHSSTVRTSLAASSAAHRLQSGHTHLQSKTIRISDLSFTTVIRLHTKLISPLCIPTSSSNATYKNGSGTMQFYLCSSKNLEQSTGRSPKLLYSDHFQMQT